MPRGRLGTARTGRADGRFGTSGPQARWAGSHEGPLQAGVQGLEAPQPAAFLPNRGPDLAGAHHLPDKRRTLAATDPSPLPAAVTSALLAQRRDGRLPGGRGGRGERVSSPCCFVRTRLFPEM